jgi:hypothetical protein
MCTFDHKNASFHCGATDYGVLPLAMQRGLNSVICGDWKMTTARSLWHRVGVLTFVVMIVLTAAGCKGIASAYSMRAMAINTRATCLPQNVAVSCSDKVCPQDLRFLFQRGDKYFVELAYDSQEIKSAFMRKFPNSPPYGFGTPLSTEQQAWLMERCGVNRNDTFSCMDMLRDEPMFAHVQAIAGYAEGGNGDFGFVGVLDVPGNTPTGVKDSLFGEKIVGVAYRASTCGTFAYQHIPTATAKEKRRIQAALRSQLKDRSCSVIKAVINPKDGIVLAMANHKKTLCCKQVMQESETSEANRSTSVFYLVPVQSKFQLVPLNVFGTTAGDVYEKGFPIEVYPSDGKDTHFSFLPDMDQDGYSELFISSREGFIYGTIRQEHPPTPSSKYTLTLVRNFHYGLRE